MVLEQGAGRTEEMTGNGLSDRIDVRFEIEEAQCIGCAVCADICEWGALEFGFQASLPVWNRSLCTGCAQCWRQCPTGAITVVQIHS